MTAPSRAIVDRRERAGAPRGAIHQFVPALLPRDATGSHTLLLRQALRQAGWQSEIYTEATHAELSGEAQHFTEYDHDAAPGDVLVYQFSTSSTVAGYLLGRPEPLVLNYHNVTTPDAYRDWEPETVRRVEQARAELARLAPRAVLGIADSAFNAGDLEALGCTRTVVAPVLSDLARLDAEPDPRVVARLAEAKAAGGADWLFVGRIVPSKAQHALVKAFWVARRFFDPSARLHLVGATPSRSYLYALRSFVADLGLSDAVRIAGEVSDAALAAYYGAADVYVSLSIHEGFGVPLVEAMRAGVPVVALDVGAVPGTLGDGGVAIDRSEPAYVAAVVQRVLGDPELRARLVEAGRRRAADHDLTAGGELAVAALASVAAAPAGEVRS